jgi:hypothetical protein
VFCHTNSMKWRKQRPAGCAAASLSGLGPIAHTLAQTLTLAGMASILVILR